VKNESILITYGTQNHEETPHQKYKHKFVHFTRKMKLSHLGKFKMVIVVHNLSDINFGTQNPGKIPQQRIMNLSVFHST